MRKIAKYLLTFTILMSIYLGFKSIFSYFDITNFCIITIDGDPLRGNEKTIKNAIKEIKLSDRKSYFDLCKSVKIIREKYCVAHSLPPQYSDDLGCFIRGTKIIYLKPDKAESVQVVKERAETIKKYSQKSKNYWQY